MNLLSSKMLRSGKLCYTQNEKLTSLDKKITIINVFLPMTILLLRAFATNLISVCLRQFGTCRHKFSYNK